MADNTRMKMLAALLSRGRLPPQNPSAPTSNWLNKPLPMEGRFNILPVMEEHPGAGPSLFNKRSLALPGMLAGLVNAFTLPGRAMRGQEVTAEDPVNFGLNFMGGGLLGSRMAPPPTGSIGMNAITRRPWFHGSNRVIDTIDGDMYFVASPNEAKFWGANVHEASVAPKNPKVINAPKDIDPVEYWDNIRSPMEWVDSSGKPYDAILVRSNSKDFQDMLVSRGDAVSSLKPPKKR